ncbi:TIGR02642 family protein [Pectobacterium parmentieri]|uniref:Uncharacterized protein n=1 Tax=Pectobacterium parmentieri TaxID=1905730 RepID=A0A8B3F2U1_PECPM|nr:TIGR02642 family protein [Pectobacterium parmentieri]AOR59560.1 hypothetical protein A8F97_11685 [Pectobacterium parmentieri]AYH09469.1 hypothetical protein C5E24_07080 [Pectobacterium parmentieri]AYH19821.1 hypothetical protein C5E22_15720 [Pectobacterium parmentieri]AYH35783.1 hypothetical protein C5E17_06950 [Pectobacterium parmentieri]AZS55850.1 hypothetical protein C5E18_06785 [Pectobacterium parmentieri]
MSSIIEHTLRLHEARSASAFTSSCRGGGKIGRDQYLGALSTASLHYPVGYDLFMLRYKSDTPANERLQAAVKEWVHLQRNTPDHAVAACLLAINLAVYRPLPPQLARRASLLRRYGAKAVRTKNLISGLNAEKKRLENKTSSKITQERAATLDNQIVLEKASLRQWSEQEAGNSDVCPCCKGSGEQIKKSGSHCPECGGDGRLVSTIDDIRKSLSATGVKVNEESWRVDYVPLVNSCLHWLDVEYHQAIEQLKRKIRQEENALV